MEGLTVSVGINRLSPVEATLNVGSSMVIA